MHQLCQKSTNSINTITFIVSSTDVPHTAPHRIQRNRPNNALFTVKHVVLSLLYPEIYIIGIFYYKNDKCHIAHLLTLSFVSEVTANCHNQHIKIKLEKGIIDVVLWVVMFDIVYTVWILKEKM